MHQRLLAAWHALRDNHAPLDGETVWVDLWSVSGWMGFQQCKCGTWVVVSAYYGHAAAEPQAKGAR